MKQLFFALFLGFSVIVFAQKNDSNIELQQQYNQKINEVKLLNSKGLVIAFYSSDSLNKNYKYLIEQDSLMQREQKRFESDLTYKQQQIKEKYEAFEKDRDLMILSGADLQLRQKEIEYLAQKIEEFQMTEGVRLKEKAVEMQNLLESKVKMYATLFCEKYELDMLIMNATGGQFTHINPVLDVTNMFVDFVNSEEAKINK